MTTTLALRGDARGIRTALAQGAVRRPTPHVITSGTRVEAKPARPICEDDVLVGDTVAASLHPARVLASRPRWWPGQIVVTLRRAAPASARDSALLRFVVVRATVDGVAVRDARADFWGEVESMGRKAGTEGMRCLARLNGMLTRTWHVR